MQEKRGRTPILWRVAVLALVSASMIGCGKADQDLGSEESTAAEPVAVAPVVEEPVTVQPADAKPVVADVTEPVVQEVVVVEPTSEEPSVTETVVGEPKEAIAAEQSVLSEEFAKDDEFASQEPESKFDPLPPLEKPWTRITPEKSRERVWVNTETRQVAVEGYVCLTKGYLELFACTAGLKEHESVVALQSRAKTLHFALLGVGARPGKTARWSKLGEYTPATGQAIDVLVEWMKDGKPTKTQAQQWIRDLKTKKAMTHGWVFGGSLLRTDPETEKTYYSADSGGEIICVSNFPVAMMDLPIESSMVNEELSFEALTESIPERQTPVRVYLTPNKADEG